MTEPNKPKYIDPNSGAAPQPGGMVVGGAESQRGDAAVELLDSQKEHLAGSQEKYLENAPTSDQEAELLRQVGVAQEQEKTQVEPAKAETPDLAPLTNDAPPAREEAPAAAEEPTPTPKRRRSASS